MGYWAESPLSREQLVLFSTTLDERIPEDHPVRLFHELLAVQDWSGWERHYCGVAGQPAVHPRVVAGAILYGLSHGIRSSRRLEWACKHAIDFMWLVENRDIDHSSFCNFRTQFHRELKDLFRQIGRLAMAMGLLRLNQVSLDGTRVRANSSPHATASAKTLQERLAALDQEVETMLAQAAKVDSQESDLFAESCSATQLPAPLSTLRRRQAALREALQAAQAVDAKRQKRSDTPKKAAKVPVADPQAALLPNKEGGYAPNYTPVTAVDGHRGLIVDSVVLSREPEAQTVLPAVQRIEANLGDAPAELLADTAFATGSNLAGLDERGVEPFMPVESARLDEQNPARRADATQPVAEANWPKLPRNAQSKKLDRAAFVYDASQDCHYCPMGRRMDPAETVRDRKQCGESVYQIYRCVSCTGCALAGDCLGGKAKARTVARDQHEPLRESLAARMRTEGGRKTYARRAWMSETPHAVLKAAMGLRQFLLRGRDKVQIEWDWACTAYNLRKVAHEIGALRAKLAWSG